MQNRYVGDIGDYLKLGILRARSPGYHLGIAWWLFPNEDHNRDERHIGYLGHPESWRHFDPRLFDALARSYQPASGMFDHWKHPIFLPIPPSTTATSTAQTAERCGTEPLDATNKWPTRLRRLFGTRRRRIPLGRFFHDIEAGSSDRWPRNEPAHD
jgi:hypothetical protein